MRKLNLLVDLLMLVFFIATAFFAFTKDFRNHIQIGEIFIGLIAIHILLHAKVLFYSLKNLFKG